MIVENGNNTRIKWIVDPGFPGYNVDLIKELIDFIENFEKPCYPSTRYWMIKEADYKHMWGAHKFWIGLENKEDAMEFVNHIGGFIYPGSFEGDNRIGENIYRDSQYWLPKGFLDYELVETNTYYLYRSRSESLDSNKIENMKVCKNRDLDSDPNYFLEKVLTPSLYKNKITGEELKMSYKYKDWANDVA